jgi:hypothetical protein
LVKSPRGPFCPSADRIFGKLSIGAQIKMPLGETFWGAYFGALTDRFGINWSIDCELVRALSDFYSSAVQQEIAVTSIETLIASIILHCFKMKHHTVSIQLIGQGTPRETVIFITQSPLISLVRRLAWVHKISE